MADVEVFFNRPGRPAGFDRLVREVQGAQERVAVAAAWFTDRSLADALVLSPAGCKLVLLNASDLRREGAQGIVERLQVLRDEEARWVAALTSRAGAATAPGGGREPPFRRLVVLGDTDWRRGVMHHKFVVIDSAVVWCGSYNPTYQARQNFEALVRIEDPEVNARFMQEAMELAFGVELFRCAMGRHLVPEGFVSLTVGPWRLCRSCWPTDEEPDGPGAFLRAQLERIVEQAAAEGLALPDDLHGSGLFQACADELAMVAAAMREGET
jgi:phosphatidylserine/phosphatidylglycerophosphate/cardiolipin synthase-like enzyme